MNKASRDSLNATFRPSLVQYPNGQSSTLTYFDNLGDQRLQTLWHKNSVGDTLSKFDYSYDVEGQIQTWTRQADAGTPNVWAAEYDRADQLLALTIHSNTIAGAILKQFVYGYDLAANRTSKEIQGGAGVPPAITAGGYNNLNQLTNTSAGGPMRFSGRLDKLATVTVAGSPATVDSRTTNFVGYANVSTGTNTVQVVAADYSGNRRTNNYQIVVSDNGLARTLLYDLNGNLTSMTTATSTNIYAWDAANRLIKVTQLSGASPLLVSQFTYDGLGRRVEIDELQNNSLVIAKKFVWCGNELCEERDASGATVTKRFFAQGQQNITLNSQPSTLNLFYTRDHLGSIREMTDSGGTIHARYDYDPYGRRTKVQGDLDADFGFTGLYFHPTSGLHLALYRAYDSGMGRWLSRDPIGERGGINLYRYVGNNVIRFADLLGLEHVQEPGFTKPLTSENIGPMWQTLWGAVGGEALWQMYVDSPGGAAFQSYNVNEPTWWGRTCANFQYVNAVIPGTFAPPGLGMVTGGATAQEAGALSLGQWALGGFPGSASGAAAFTSLETGVIAGAVALVNTTLVAVVWETSVFVGSAVGALFQRPQVSCYPK